MTIDRESWGYRRQAKLSDMLSTHDIIAELATTVSCGGNLLLNVGPTHDGRIVPLFQERLKEIGDWLKINGESIYNTTHWTYQNDTTSKHVWYTKSKENSPINSLYYQTKGVSLIYCILLKWPDNGHVVLSSPETSSATQISMLGLKESLFITWKRNVDENVFLLIYPRFL